MPACGDGLCGAQGPFVLRETGRQGALRNPHAYGLTRRCGTPSDTPVAFRGAVIPVAAFTSAHELSRGRPAPSGRLVFSSSCILKGRFIATLYVADYVTCHKQITHRDSSRTTYLLRSPQTGSHASPSADAPGKGVRENVSGAE